MARALEQGRSRKTRVVLPTWEEAIRTSGNVRSGFMVLPSSYTRVIYVSSILSIH
jgi:hypothetical protein